MAQQQNYEVVPDLLGEAIAKNFRVFLKRFSPDQVLTTDTETHGASQYTDADRLKATFYGRLVEEMREKESNTLTVDFKHLRDFNEEMAQVIVDQYYRVEPFLRKAVQAFVRSIDESFVINDNGKENEFYVSFINVSSAKEGQESKETSLRDLKMSQIGRLSCFTGTVTRTSEVRPELFLGSFRCLECSQVVRSVPQQFKMTFPCICPNATCGNRKNWLLLRDESIFVDWQKAKVQENPDEVPAGSMPRSVDIIIRANQVEQVRPGDRMVFSGCLITVPDVSVLAGPEGKLETRVTGVNRGGTSGGAGEGVSGLKSLGVRELTYRTAFLVSSVRPHRGSKEDAVNIREDEDLSPEAVFNAFTEQQQRRVSAMRQDPQLYDRMAKSIAPGVHGGLDIKRSVLLQLLGGVHKKTPEGVPLRGDINVLIVGDPSCAKSQILKYVSKFLPRAVYTSGKASSAAGLTASVVKDPDSNEFCIEAGALLLADNGICCIDEFDKMDVKDQVAIHEAMEQQTISIAKAGVQASLNARTSILAAANPGGGRYDKSKPLRYNVALPPAIMSRFDMVHIMIDEPNEVTDEELAYHIVDLHQNRDSSLEIPYTTEELQCYIKYARAFKPELSDAAKRLLVQSYVRIRQQNDAHNQRASYRVTVRQLEAVIRLSEALARLHCEGTVRVAHVKAALKLVQSSMLEVELGEETELDDPMEGVMNAALRAEREAEAIERANLEAGAQEEEMGEDGAPRATQAAPPAAPPAKPKQKIQASVYRRIRTLVCKKLEMDRVRARKLLELEVAEQLRAEAEEAQVEAAAAVQVEGGDEEGGEAMDVDDADPAPAARKSKEELEAERQRKRDERERQREEREEARRARKRQVDEKEAELRGMTLGELMRWFAEYTVEVLKLSGEQAQEETALVPAVVQHLIRKEGIVVVVGQRDIPSEDLTAWERDDGSAAGRQMLELKNQVLSLSDEFSLDDE